MLFYLNFSSSKNTEKMITVFTQILSSTAILNNDINKKCFLSSKSSYVTLDNKTSHKGEIYTSSDSWINKLSLMCGLLW